MTHDGMRRLSSSPIFSDHKSSVYVLIEFSSFTSSELLTQRVQAFVERSAEVGLAEEAIFSRDGNSEATMWALREAIPTCLMDMSRQHEPECAAKLFKYDVSLPQASQMPLVMQIVSDQLISEGHEVVDSASGDQDDSLVSFKICGFGHVGDGNLHLNILMRSPLRGASRDSIVSTFQTQLDRIVYENIVALNGSVSAEHGIGQLKRDIMSFAKSAEELHVMSLIKKSLDPRNILNPGKVLPE